jgi:hypothetical protein
MGVVACNMTVYDNVRTSKRQTRIKDEYSYQLIFRQPDYWGIYWSSKVNHEIAIWTVLNS